MLLAPDLPVAGRMLVASVIALVANLAYLLLPTSRHAVILPGAALMAMVSLIGGQVILERVLSYDTVLAVVIEFIGGIVFLSSFGGLRGDSTRQDIKILRWQGCVGRCLLFPASLRRHGDHRTDDQS